MFTYVSRSSARLLSLAAGIALLCPLSLYAQTVERLPFTVGSSNPVSAEPGVSRPTTTPCVVHLFANEAFDDYADHDTTYTPPAGCKGPWSKVVFTANFNVSEGRQFDRSTKFFLGGANIFFGTTAEPRSTLSPSWHVERDITDLSALLTSKQPVVLSLYNVYGEDGGVDYNGSITGSADIRFYPANIANPAAAVPDAVLPLNPAGAITALSTTADRLTRTFTGLPRNIEGAWLQVISQSQASDEFWYTCSPSSVASQLQNCGNSAFRETEVYIDGKAAGIAPVYPWIYTGGLDPYLWEPIVGVQTLNLKPYMVDLTPFAGMLSDGDQHTVAVGVYNANSEFDVTGTLLLYLDHGSAKVTGKVTENTLDQAPTPYVSAPAPTVTKQGVTQETSFVTSLRAFHLSGYVNTSHGRVVTTLDESVDFGNVQDISLSNLTYNQSLTQISSAQIKTRTKTGPIIETSKKNITYPLILTYAFTQNADGSYKQSANIDQQNNLTEAKTLLGVPVYNGSSHEQVKTADAYSVTAAGVLSQTSSSTGSYLSHDSNGGCYNTTITSADLKLTKVETGQGCPGGVNNTY